MAVSASILSFITVLCFATMYEGSPAEQIAAAAIIIVASPVSGMALEPNVLAIPAVAFGTTSLAIIGNRYVKRVNDRMAR